MLNLALVGLLTGSLVTGAPDGDRDRDRDRNQAAPAAEQADVPQPRLGLIPQPGTPAGEQAIINDTYAFGRAADEAPIKIWVHYGFGETDRIYNLQGDPETLSPYSTDGEIQAQRIGVGAQVNVLNFPSFKFGVGAQLNMAQDKFDVETGETDGGFFPDGRRSDFGLQNVKVYGQLMGRVVGVHGGYIFDLASDPTYTVAVVNGVPTPIPDELSTSDGRDALFFGADFDYPAEVIRLFGGIDYYHIMNDDDVVPGFPGSTFRNGENDHDDILHFTLGAGLRFSIFEVGAALMMRTQFTRGTDNAVVPTGGAPPVAMQVAGGHYGSIAPYIRVTPGFIPASLFIKGAVLREYTDYGFRLGGSNDILPTAGFTAGLTVGFN